MDRLELVVHHGQAHQRIDIVCFMDVALPVGQLVPEQFLSLWWCIDDRARDLVHQGRAGCRTDVEINALDPATDDNRYRRGHRALLE